MALHAFRNLNARAGGITSVEEIGSALARTIADTASEPESTNTTDAWTVDELWQTAGAHMALLAQQGEDIRNLTAKAVEQEKRIADLEAQILNQEKEFAAIQLQISFVLSENKVQAEAMQLQTARITQLEDIVLNRMRS